MKPIFIIRFPIKDDSYKFFDYNYFINRLPDYEVIIIVEKRAYLKFEMFSPLTCDKIEIEKLKSECQKAFNKIHTDLKNTLRPVTDKTDIDNPSSGD